MANIQVMPKSDGLPQCGLEASVCHIAISLVQSETGPDVTITFKVLCCELSEEFFGTRTVVILIWSPLNLGNILL